MNDLEIKILCVKTIMERHRNGVSNAQCYGDATAEAQQLYEWVVKTGPYVGRLVPTKAEEVTT